jgi:hypothetical protein
LQALATTQTLTLFAASSSYATVMQLGDYYRTHKGQATQAITLQLAAAFANGLRLLLPQLQGVLSRRGPHTIMMLDQAFITCVKDLQSLT